MKPLSECRLYTFIDTSYLEGRDPAVVAKELCDGGSDIIQLRAKDMTSDEVRRLFDKVFPVTERFGVPLVINDFRKLALECGASYCHLGREDFFGAGFRHVSEVIPESRPDFKIGLSSRSPEEAIPAIEAGAAYLGVGPVFKTATKPGSSPVTTEYVKWAAANISIPWFAIGGITPDNIGEVIEAGATRVAVVSAILKAPDIARACNNFKQRLISH
ncbi:MAG: thiamine phosphate synthase [Verrucomicrobia bacterium]|nr:thiamine phosphate synthase [Verrucomicrobiota bacterium]MCF7708621.1 thiamine phosphate synthase [Verrucomicrobiota bacterium]